MLFTFQKSEPETFFFWFEIGEIDKDVHKKEKDIRVDKYDFLLNLNVIFIF